MIYFNDFGGEAGDDNLENTYPRPVIVKNEHQEKG